MRYRVGRYLEYSSLAAKLLSRTAVEYNTG